MIVKVRKIGNSSGVILSKGMMEQCHIKDEVKVEVRENEIIISPAKRNPREGWEEQFLKAGSLNDKEFLLGDFNNDFDENEWTWE